MNSTAADTTQASTDLLGAMGSNSNDLLGTSANTSYAVPQGGGT